jgi:hypothetical protein
MLRRRLNLARIAALLVALLVPCAGLAQTTAELDAKIRERWTAIFNEVTKARGLTVEGNQLSGTAEQKAAAYREMVQRINRDPDLIAMAFPDRSLVSEKVRDEDRKFVDAMIQQNAETVVAKSVDSRATNPSAGSLTERSGFTELIALALNGRNLISADDTAVSLNLSGLALISLADPNVYSELYRYQQHSLMRRIGGTVVFGAKVPQKEITGFSGFPGFDELLDVFVWDVKVRVLGDRDPRSEKWYPLTLGRGGLAVQLNPVVLGLVPTGDLGIVRDLLSEALGANVAAIKQAIARSPQLTAKFSGTHLTKEEGRNRYSFGALFDAGVGPADITANLLYAITDDVRLGPEEIFEIKQWTVSGSMTTHFAANAISVGRTVDLSVGALANLFRDTAQLPFPVDNTWRVFTTVDVPIGDAARIPVSVIYTNDPNALVKTNYVVGQIGISYDFSALKRLFRP